MRTLLATGLLSLCLFACPKNVTTTVAGTDDERMDQYAAQLEEIRTRGEVTCQDACSLRKKTCDLSSEVCAISGKSPERKDFQQRCVTAQEDCAQLSEKCSGCN